MSRTRLDDITACFDTFAEIEAIKKAYQYACHLYAGQHLPGGGALIDHTLRVAHVLLDELQMKDVDTVCAALLLKALESPEVTYDSLIGRFGMGVATMVRTVTKESSDGQRNDSDLTTRLYFKRIFGSTPKVIRLKLASRLDAVRHVVPHMPPEEREEYLRETERYFVGFAANYNDTVFRSLQEAIAAAREGDAARPGE